MVGPRRKLDGILFDKKEKRKKMGVKQDESPRPFVKGSEGPVAWLTFVMHRIVIRHMSTSINVNRIG